MTSQHHGEAEQELDADLDESGLLSGPPSSGGHRRGIKRILREGSWYRDGPADLAGVMSLCADRLKDALRDGPALGTGDGLRQLAHMDTVVTTTYSGIGRSSRLLTRVIAVYVRASTASVSFTAMQQPNATSTPSAH